MVKYGMSPAQALRSANMSAAELLGMQDQVGSIEARQIRRHRRRARRSDAGHSPTGARRLRDEGRRRVQGRSGQIGLLALGFWLWLWWLWLWASLFDFAVCFRERLRPIRAQRGSAGYRAQFETMSRFRPAALRPYTKRASRLKALGSSKNDCFPALPRRAGIGHKLLLQTPIAGSS